MHSDGLDAIQAVWPRMSSEIYTVRVALGSASPHRARQSEFESGLTLKQAFPMLSEELHIVPCSDKLPW